MGERCLWQLRENSAPDINCSRLHEEQGTPHKCEWSRQRLEVIHHMTWIIGSRFLIAIPVKSIILCLHTSRFLQTRAQDHLQLSPVYVPIFVHGEDDCICQATFVLTSMNQLQRRFHLVLWFQRDLTALLSITMYATSVKRSGSMVVMH